MENIQLEILDKLKSKELKNYLSKLDINNALVFGSIITDNFNEESDVDIAILWTSKLTIKEILKLELFLEDLLERNIDVIDLNSDNLDIFIKIDILNDGKSIYTTDNNKFLEKFIEKVDWYYRENEGNCYHESRKINKNNWRYDWSNKEFERL